MALIDQIFPIAREFLACDDLGSERMGLPSTTPDHDLIARLQMTGIAQGQHRHPQGFERLHQTETALIIVSEHMGLHDPTLVGGQPDFFGLGNQVADGDDEAIIPNDNALARPLRAERLGGEGIVRGACPKGNHCGQSVLEVIAESSRIGLVLRRDFPFVG